MSEKLDNKVLNLISRMLDSHSEDALLVRQIWKDRDILLRSLDEISAWDMTHSESLSTSRVQLIIQNTRRDIHE